jgi:UDP-glucose 4-epimerase
VADVVDTVGEILGKELNVIQDPERIRPEASEVMRLISSPRLAGELLGWTPQVDLEEGLRRTVEWIERSRERFRTEHYVI